MNSKSGFLFLMTLIIFSHLVSGAAPVEEKSNSPQSKYEFTVDWFTWNTQRWPVFIDSIKGKPSLNALEVGTYEGRGAVWLLENILTDKNSTLTCIDIFDLAAVENRFDKNIQATGVGYKVKKLKGPSQEKLRELPLLQYDLIYIDGCHHADCVLTDAVLSFGLLKQGGLLIFDDYLYNLEPGLKNWPRTSIHAFMDIYNDYIEVVDSAYQMVFRKTTLAAWEKM